MRWISVSLVALILSASGIWLRPAVGGEPRSGKEKPAAVSADAVPPHLTSADERPFDVLSKNYAPYCTPNDDLAFPMKVWALSENKFTFWRGSRDMYFAWCRTHAKEWLDDKGSYLVNH